MRGVKYSIVIPAYNEEDSVKPLAASIKDAMEPLAEPYEIIFVNDGSTDKTLPRLKEAAAGDDMINIITLERNSGQTASLNAGFAAAGGGIVISMDGDMQNDPADIPSLLAKLDEGYDVVCGWRRRRFDTQWKKVSSKMANVIQNVVFKSHLHDLACTLRAYKKEHLAVLDLGWNGAHRFIPYLLLKHGSRIAEVEVHHHARRYGRSKYKPTKIFKTIKDFLRLIITRKI